MHVMQHGETVAMED